MEMAVPTETVSDTGAPTYRRAMRLQRALARAGIASRRSSEELISAGRVTVYGTVAHIGQVVDAEHDDIRVDGKKVKQPSGQVWLLLHKPSGVMTTRADRSEERRVGKECGSRGRE